MSQTRPIIPVEGSASTARLAARRRRDGDGTLLSFPVLDEQPGWLGRRVAALPREGHPVWTYVCGILVAFALIASISIALGLVVTRVLLHVHGVAGDDERFVAFLARHRSSGLTDASLVGSIIAGGVVLPIVAGVAALAACLAKRWRLAGFLLFALAVEAGSYRATTLVVHRHRPGGSPSREPVGRRELSVRAHRGFDRGLRRHRPAAHLADQEPRGAGGDLGRRCADPGVRRALSHVSRHAPSTRRRWVAS